MPTDHNAAASFNPIDKLVAWLNPRAGLLRHMDRLRLARAYEAASPRDSWRPRRRGASANTDHLADGAALRDKARSLVQNVPYIEAGLSSLVAQTVGTGIVPRSTSPIDTDRINTLWARWVTECDADGQLDFYGIQAAAYRAMEQDGEVLLRLRPRFASDGLAVPLQLQLLEIDWLDSTRIAGNGPNNIVNGIEYDPLGRIVAYWLWDQHPGDVMLRRGRTQSRPVPAASIIHLFNPRRPGQGRGITRLAPVITRVRDLQLYEDAEIARKNLETRLSVLASGDVAMMANPSTYNGTANPAAARSSGDLGQLASGGITELPAGVNLTVVEPKWAPGHVEYVRHQLHMIAVGMGITYEMMTGHMAETNYSSARVRLMDIRREIEQHQWLTVIPRFINPVWRAFNDAAHLAGKIARPNYLVDYATPKWEYVNPEQDVRADADAIASGLTTISECIRRRGYNPATVFEELRTDFDTLEKSGVLRTLLLLQRGRLVEDLTPATPADKAKTKAGA